MNIEGIIICVNFSDYLAETLPRNRFFFNRVTVVTSPEDVDTQQIAMSNGCRVVKSTSYLDGGDFNKGKLINEGIAASSKRCWLCHIDADCVLPTGLRPKIAELEPKLRKHECIVGLHRKLIESYADWLRYTSGNKSVAVPERDGFNRPVKRQGKNVVPVGYFQLWHTDSKQLYPEDCPSANTSDVGFGKKFRQRVFIDDYVLHLSSEKHQRGTDWEGRTSKPWG